MAYVERREGKRGVRYRVRYYDTAGDQRSKTFKAKADADTFAATTEADKYRGDWNDPRLADTAYKDWVKTYLASKVNVKDKTLYNYESMVDNHINPEWGGVSLGNIEPTAVQRWINDLCDDYAAKTVRYIYMVFKSSLKLAVQQGYLAKTPCSGINLPRVRRKEPTFLTAKQVTTLAESMGQHRLLVYFLAYSGCRWGEATAVQYQALMGNRVRVTRAYVSVGGTLRIDTPKNHRARTVVIPSFLADELAGLDRSPGDLLFTTETGAVLRNSNFRTKVWYPTLEKLGLDLRIHDLRHTCASLLISQGANPKAVQTQLGHHSVSFTLDVYGHLFDSDMNDLAARMDALHKSA